MQRPDTQDSDGADPGAARPGAIGPCRAAAGCRRLRQSSLLNFGPCSIAARNPSAADYVSVSPGYFRVMGIPLLRGRTFRAEDSLSAPRVAIINEALVRYYFPNQEALRQRLVFGFPPDTNVSWEIVGVVGDVRDVALRQEPGPMMYVPFAQAPF